MIALTFDTDWVTDEIILNILILLKKWDVKVTFFVTNNTPVSIFNGYEDIIEIAIHPDFSYFSYKESMLEELVKQYPKAKGVRSHRLITSSDILLIYKEFGLEYSMDIFIPYCDWIQPFERIFGLIMIPYFWEDDEFLKRKLPKNLAHLNLWHSENSLKIYNFHPIHIFLNTPNLDLYRHYKDNGKLYDSTSIYNGNGIGTLFKDFLKYLNTNNIETYTGTEISDQFKLSEQIN